MRERLRTRTAALLSAAAMGATLVSGCGDDEDFKNNPRPPVPVQLTGVVTDQRVTVSPARVKPGPIVLIINNQATESHEITLNGPDVDEETGPINSGDTATLQATLKRTTGDDLYQVKANSTKGAVNPEDVIRPARIRVSGTADSSSDELLLP